MTSFSLRRRNTPLLLEKNRGSLSVDVVLLHLYHHITPVAIYIDIKLMNGPKADVSGAILPLTSYWIVNREIQNHVYRKRQNANLNNVTIDHFSFSNLRIFQLESEV